MSAGSEDAGLISTVTNTIFLERLRNPQDRTVWQQFVNRYRPMIMSYACNSFGLSGQNAEDAAQTILSTFCEVYQKGRYDREKGRLRTWLFGIATNELKNMLRKAARNREIQIADATDGTGFMPRVPDDDARLEDRWEEEWRRAVYQQCMVEVRAQFDAKTVDAFELFAKQGLAAQEVADKLGMTQNAVFLAKHKILKRIRELVPLMEESW